jgi:Tfp pilus assembly protein PilX
VPAISNRPVVQRRPSVSDERGMALIVALLSMMLLMALGISLTLTTTTETMVTSNYSSGVEAMYAADAGIERTMQDLLTVSDWNTVLASADGVTSNQMSGFTSSDMSPTLGDGRELDLLKATNMANCPHISPPSSTPCSTAQMNQYTEERPWTLNNPRWRLYAHGPVEDFVPTGTINSPFYIAVWVADDPSDNDNDPTSDGNPPPGGGTNPGEGVIQLRAEAFGPAGAHRIIETTLARTDSTEIERGYTGQRGQDEQNRRARKAAVQTTGKLLTRSEMGLGGGF